MFNSKLNSIPKSPTIGIVAPSSPESHEYIDEKISIFENLGFKIKKGIRKNLIPLLLNSVFNI